MSARSSATARPRVAAREPIWWGAIAAIAVFSSMHSTLAFAAIYLAQGAEEWPPPETPLPSLALPAVAVGLAAVALLCAILTHRAVGGSVSGRLQLGAGVTAVVLAAAGAVSVADLLALGYDHTVNAFASAYWVNVGFHLLITLAVVVALLVFALRNWARAEGAGGIAPRMRSGLVATLLLTYYAAATWASVYGVLHLLPRFWVGGTS